MQPNELRIIVDAWGGVRAFAALIRVDRSTVYKWLDGTRSIGNVEADRIRLLGVLPR